MEQPNLSGKIAVVTGASRGLGLRTAARLAKHGASVALVARSAGALAAAVETIRAAGGTAIPIPADVGQIDAADRIRTVVERDLGQPSILVNGAGVFGPIQLIKDSDPSAWLETLMINTVSAYALTRAFLNGMLDAGWGRIISLSSAASLHPPGPLNSAYATSKVALNQFTRHLAAEIAGSGVTANVIHPGDVKTEMWDYIRQTSAALPGDLGAGERAWSAWVEQTGGDDPEKTADLILHLVSDAGAAINGRFLWIEGGLQAPIPSWDAPRDERPWTR
jgi:NAD(P)-dependent dehydrogenase (short-subunit alcohol dehydrogenase family)